MSDDNSDTLPKVVVDRAKNNTSTGDIRERTVLVKVGALGTKSRGRRAIFTYDPERRHYTLSEYEYMVNKLRGWRSTSTKFRQKDVDILRYIANHLTVTADESVEVTLFGGTE